jgi:hypothetical protein
MPFPLELRQINVLIEAIVGSNVWLVGYPSITGWITGWGTGKQDCISLRAKSPSPPPTADS